MKTFNNITIGILIVLLNFAFSSVSFSQTPIVFSKTYQINATIENVWPTADKGYIACGYYERWDTLANSWDYDHYILKTDSFGNIQWEKIYDFTPLDGWCIEGSTVRELNNGYAFISSINCAQNPPNPLSKYILLRLDNNGDTMWTQTYERPKRCMGQWVEPTSDGGFIMTGYAADFGTSADVYIVKADSMGQEKWNKTYQLYGEDQATCVRQTSDGGYIVAAGSSHAYALARTWLLKLNPNGDTAWTKIFPWGMWNINAYLEITPDNGFIVAVKDSSLYQKAFKTDSLGNLLWFKNFGLGNACIAQTSDNGFAAFGSNYFTKLDSNGFVLHTNSNNIHPTFWQQTLDGGYITAIDSSLIKTDCRGNYTFWDTLHCPVNTGGVSTEVPSLIKPKIAIYPNPSSGEFTVEGDNIQQIEIFDLTGRTIYKTIFINETKQSIDLSKQSNGIYLISIISNKEVVVKKVVLK